MADTNGQLATLASNIKQGVENRLKDLHTSMPGIVESFNAATQTASIQPAIKRVFKTGDGEIELLTATELPILINVPVQFPRGGGFSLTFPVAKGDECLLVFCERAIADWYTFGGVKAPTARRFHSLSDATAFVGLSSFVKRQLSYDDTNVQLKKDTGTVAITLLANGTIEVDANTKVTVTAPSIALVGNTAVTGTLDVSGVVTAPTGNITTVTSTTVSSGTVAASANLTVAGKEMGGHEHDQDDDSNGDSQARTEGPA